jgi:hypothetical protein
MDISCCSNVGALHLPQIERLPDKLLRTLKHAERNISFSKEQHHVLPHPFQIEAAVSNYIFTT